jgi:hypothetical protein
VAEKVEKIHVHGGFDTLLQRVITLSDESKQGSRTCAAQHLPLAFSTLFLGLGDS